MKSRRTRSAGYFAVAVILFTLGGPSAANAADLPLVALICEQRNELPWVDVGSDGIALPAGVHTAFGRPHPRSFGTFTHILADVVRNRHVLTLEEAVHKMTAQPANRLGIASLDLHGFDSGRGNGMNTV